MMKTFKIGGIHPAANKMTAGEPVQLVAMPAELTLMLSQSIGAPSKVVVKAGDHLEAGQLVAEAGGFVGAPIHAPLAATVKKIDKVRNAQGLWQDAVVLSVDEGAELSEAGQFRANGVCDDPKPDIAGMAPEEIVKMIGEAGVVGLGGATFPTRVKLTVPQGKKADVVLINGAECEPYLTCDDRLMRIHAGGIVQGLRLLMRAVSAPAGYIGIEENKPEAIKLMQAAAAEYDGIKVIPLKKKYPQGGEKQLIAAVTGREVPMGGLPIDVGCIVDNVATAYAVYRAVIAGQPLTARIVTVTGRTVRRPGNYLVPFGMSIRGLLEEAGGIPDGTGKIIAGGPMMGRAVSNIDAPATKGLSGLLVLPEEESHRKSPGPCIRCGKCVDACPMGLEPYLLMLYAEHDRWEDARDRNAMGCIECGCCSYSCPSHRPILDYIKLSKIQLRKK